MGARKITQEDLDAVAGLSSRDAAAQLGVGKTAINDARALARDNNGHLPSQPTDIDFISTVPKTKEEMEASLAKRGFTNDTHRITWSFSEWDAGDTVKYSARASVSERSKTESAAESIDWAAGSKFIEDFIYIPSKLDYLTDTAVLQPTDYQIGKTDTGGGTAGTEELALASFAAFADRVTEYRPRNVLFANTGDIIENFCNTPSQRDTNDLDLPHQVLRAYQLELAGIKMLAPLVQNFTYATVPSNHGRWRTGLKGDAGDPHADWGIVIAKQVASTLEFSGSFDNVQVAFPAPWMESLTVAIGNSRIGLVHGHQAGGPDKMGEWWARQDHGRMPTWDADVLLVGHWHSYRAYQSGDKRWVIVGATSEPGSSWYSNLRGESSVRGMVSFFIDGPKWSHLEII